VDTRHPHNFIGKNWWRGKKIAGFFTLSFLDNFFDFRLAQMWAKLTNNLRSRGKVARCRKKMPKRFDRHSCS